MYESFYKLKDEPFRLSPDPRYCYKHRSYVQAEGYLRYGIERAEGIVMVIGAPGTGKSTLISELLAGFPPSKVLIGTLVVTRLETDDLFRAVAYSLNLTVEGMDRASVLRCLELFLTEQAQKGKRALLIVDEAQNLTVDRLEDLRLLTNLQMGNRPLLQIFLLGQESLREKVREPGLKQLLQRVIAAAHLDPLEADETRDYVEERLVHAGWQEDPFIADDAFTLIHQYSGGIPRRINQLCSRLFLYGAVDEKHELDASDVHAVLEDFRKELLVPEDEQQSLDEIARAYTQQRRSYQPRVVTGSGRPAAGRRTDGGKNEASRPSVIPGDRLGRPSLPEPKSPGAPARERDEPVTQIESGRSENARPRLQTVPRSSINETLRALAADDAPSLSASRHERPATPRRDAPAPERARNVEPSLRAQDGPSLYADARGERRARPPGPTVRTRYDEDLDAHYARDGRDRKGSRWLTLLMVAVLILASLYVANPFLKEQFGIDLGAIMSGPIAALTGAEAPSEPPSLPATQPPQPAAEPAAPGERVDQ